MGMSDFRWPLLDKVKIIDCPQLMMFTSDPTVLKGMPWSFHNLIEINKEFAEVEEIIPSHALLRLQKLFQVALEGKTNSGFNESQTVIRIPNLTQVKLRSLKHLKYLWKSNQWTVLEFPSLTTVSIYNCNSLEHAFTCSMVGSLVQLQDLRISECMNLEVIVKEEEECDGKVNEIMLPHLKSLKLIHLPSLKGFCLGKEAFSLPVLDTLEIKRCQAITVTPKLKVIDTHFGLCYVGGDLNSFIKTKQEEGHPF
ncbi:hypothetical protein L1987_06316 [Smallanthus sonchifolius]|uniref:Uncharacterized protein n=1 Tax=Smallanthus sonchifolius TaxID=185202 RepID=A0ACB9JXZ0_9ASTR|nr:hypothetical protein L1987_06316 [Smallanthus sonchifolius]